MDPNAALAQWRKYKTYEHAQALRDWVRNGGFEPKWTAAEKRQIMVATFGPSEVNDEGLTFIEWLTAAGITNRDIAAAPAPFAYKRKCVRAWVNGEDPAEYRATKGNPMAAKKKKTRKKTARKNPTRHIPKTNRGRKPTRRTFKVTLMDGKGALLGIKSWKTGSIADAEMKAAKMVKGKVRKVILDY